MIDARADTYAQEVDTDDLKADLERQKERFDKLQNTISSHEQSKTEETIESIEKNIENSENDTDDKQKAARDLRELKSDIDKLESERSIDVLADDFKEKLQQVREVLENIADENERSRVQDVANQIEEEGDKAIKEGDKQSLVRYNDQLDDIMAAIRQNDPDFWKGLLAYIVDIRDSLTNQTESTYHIDQGIKAAENNDFEELKRHVRSLLTYLPKDEQEKMEKGMAGITK
jgi:small-conductance mechanosensitive channel